MPCEHNKVSGGFSSTKVGNLSLDKREWKWRIKELTRTINKYLDCASTKEVAVEKLFYDIK